MKLSKSLNNRSINKPKPTDWFAFVTDDHVKLVIPVGPRFQAEVPPWNRPVSRCCLTIDDNKSGNSKWLGTQIWPMKGRSPDANFSMIGRGRFEACECAFPGSIECVREHVSEKKLQLQIDLGPAFWIWKFDEMGEDVCKLWNPKEQEKFEYMVKMNAKSHGKSFIDSFGEYFPCQTKRYIVSYYLNVYTLRRISIQTRSNCMTIDTDDDDNDNDDDGNMLHLKGARKRLQVSHFASGSKKYVKTAYLTSRR